MININVNGTSLTCLPENIADYRLKLEKASKIRKPIAPRKCSRRFPKGPASTYSTAVYVADYLRLNGLDNLFVGGLDGWILNSEPTTWPEGPECEAFTDYEPDDMGGFFPVSNAAPIHAAI